jgi:hypothetical protein
MRPPGELKSSIAEVCTFFRRKRGTVCTFFQKEMAIEDKLFHEEMG